MQIHLSKKDIPLFPDMNVIYVSVRELKRLKKSITNILIKKYSKYNEPAKINNSKHYADKLQKLFRCSYNDVTQVILMLQQIVLEKEFLRPKFYNISFL